MRHSFLIIVFCWFLTSFCGPMKIWKKMVSLQKDGCSTWCPVSVYWESAGLNEVMIGRVWKAGSGELAVLKLSWKQVFRGNNINAIWGRICQESETLNLSISAFPRVSFVRSLFFVVVYFCENRAFRGNICISVLT